MLKLLLDFLAAHVFLAGVGLLLFLGAFVSALFFRYIPNNRVGIVEKLASPKGSIVSGLIALHGEHAQVESGHRQILARSRTLADVLSWVGGWHLP